MSNPSKNHPSPRSRSAGSLWLPFVALLLLAAVILSACGAAPTPAAQVQAAPGRINEISVDQAYQKREAGAFMLDVRQPEEWEAAHIPDATLIPLGELASRVAEVPKDQEIVVYCRSGNRSQEGARILQQAGFSNVSSMAGGIIQWNAAGYPTVTGK